MANRLEPDFVKTGFRILPKIRMFIVCKFIKRNNKLNAAEIRNAKAVM